MPSSMAAATVDALVASYAEITMTGSGSLTVMERVAEEETDAVSALAARMRLAEEAGASSAVLRASPIPIVSTSTSCDATAGCSMNAETAATTARRLHAPNAKGARRSELCDVCRAKRTSPTRRRASTASSVRGGRKRHALLHIRVTKLIIVLDSAGLWPTVQAPWRQSTELHASHQVLWIFKKAKRTETQAQNIACGTIRRREGAAR